MMYFKDVEVKLKLWLRWSWRSKNVLLWEEVVETEGVRRGVFIDFLAEHAVKND